jgi:hypothetical protein
MGGAADVMELTRRPPAPLERPRPVALPPAVRALAASWNWKAAVCSSIVRASLFAATNAAAGFDAAAHAALVELSYRGVASGVYGAATQALSRARPRWCATLMAVVCLPLAGHGVEWLVHRAAGTALLSASISASVALSVVSTAFNLYAMRRGVLVVGPAGGSLAQDFRRLPRLVADFLLAPFRGV